MRLEEANGDCTARERETQACAAEVTGLLVGRGCTVTTEVRAGGELRVEELPGAELRDDPVIVRTLARRDPARARERDPPPPGLNRAHGARVSRWDHAATKGDPGILLHKLQELGAALRGLALEEDREAG